VAGHYWACQMVIIVCGITGGCFLYQSKLILRFMSSLGIIGYPLSIVAPLLDMFSRSAGIIIFLPGSLFEIIYPIWLIVKGFNSSAAASGSTKKNTNQV
jgi:hypothetical protein